MLNPLSPKPYLPTPRPTVQVSLLSAFLLHCMILVRGWCGVLIRPGAGLGYVRARTEQAEHTRVAGWRQGEGIGALVLGADSRR